LINKICKFVILKRDLLYNIGRIQLTNSIIGDLWSYDFEFYKRPFKFVSEVE